MIWNITTPIPMRLTDWRVAPRMHAYSHLEFALSLVLAYAATSTLPALAANVMVLDASTHNALPIMLTYRGLMTLQVGKNKAGAGAGQDAWKGAESMLVVILVYVIEWVVAYWYSPILIQCAHCSDTIYICHICIQCHVRYSIQCMPTQYNSILQLSQVVEHWCWYNKQYMVIIDTNTTS